MSAVVIIPARAGSRGVPGKNFRLCAGKPLLVWSIQSALEAVPLVERIVVSSDSEQAAEIAEWYDGVEFLPRPQELATDEALTDPVLVDALRTLGRGASLPEYTVLLQPTVPVRRPGLVRDCIEAALASGKDTIFTGYRTHFLWRRRERPLSGGLCELVTPTPSRVRRQDVPLHEQHYAEDGSVYVTKTSFLLQYERRMSPIMDIVETEQTVDIDTEADFLKAEWMLMAKQAATAPEPVEAAPARRRKAR